ncbi:hypothetical protein RZR97_03955 [Hydrogenimonas thermophila]|uniref:hypothetical protein n=1 Tax=Hydrogenimonas thermophila TaxID=223786 RepID=UPI002937006D|nr:hypothetical protein [Hydrogenimonas thermophila]WOE70731.1 hypothetical protein RZR91_03970 [Hydrogenimonas thermophila]WOE73249.1 hypothetical protein RZR97_03955 [Hydrogenimonas thermophila]
MKVFTDEGQCFIDLEHSLTIKDVSTLLIKLSATNIKEINEFFIHGMDLKEFDTAGLQILIAIKKYADKNNKEFQMSVGKKETELIKFYEMDEYFKGAIV